MIWEQTVNLTRPLRSVQLDVDASRADDPAATQPSTSHQPSSSQPNRSPDVAVPAAVSQEPADVGELLARLSDSLQQRREVDDRMMHQLHVAAVEVAMAVTERMFLTRIEQGDQQLERLVNEALSVLQPSGPVVVRLHPDDRQGLQPTLTEFNKGAMTLVSDESMRRGNCQIDGDEFGVRFDWAAQLTELRQQLLKGLTGANAAT